MKVIKGDLIKLAKQHKFDVIVHGCNCFCVMGAGIAKQIKQEFPKAYEVDLKTNKGDKSKLGWYSKAYIKQYNLIIINAYTQYGYWGKEGKVNANYEAIKRVFNRIYKVYNDKKIGIPMIGAGLAGGNWKKIGKIINDIGFNNITLVKYNKYEL
jgi:O-acetyl-ADP-ribose deacetylase (regulator of RNase III)